MTASPARRAVELLQRRHREVTAGSQRGTTLIELVVGMVLMVICGSVFTSAVLTLQRTSNQAQAITDASSQNNRAFQTLDRTVRYASAVSVPGVGASAAKNWYVELRNTTSGSEVCTQLRIDNATSQLQSRTWSASSPTTTLTSWVPLASGVTNGTVAAGQSQPFLPVTSATQQRQRLKFSLVSTSGPANQRSSSSSTFTLTAANSTPSPTGSICQQAGRP